MMMKPPGYDQAKNDFMKEILTIQGYDIKVIINEHSLHIDNDEALKKLLRADLKGNTDLLVQSLNDHFLQRNKKAFDVAPDSIAVEIWGHVYAEYFALYVKRLLDMKLIDGLLEKVFQICEVIDCGEKGYDHNRKLWDMLAPFKATIAGWLSDND